MDMMDALISLGILLFATWILGPIGFFLCIGLRGRVLRAEQKIAALETQLAEVRHSGVVRAAIPDAMPPPEPQADEAEVAPSPPVETPPEPAPPELPPIAPQPVSVPQIPPSYAAPPPPPSPPAPRSVEELLGTRWTVWVGGVALALGGLLLVRYSIEQGWFGPAARIVAGFLFAAALIAAGEVLRRRDRAGASPAQIPAILTAAGTISAFGTVYAAHALYDFIGPGAAFVLLGLIGVATMVAAALHAPWLAGLGLVGAFVAPLLVASKEPAPWPVVIYIGFVAAFAYGLARLRLWFWLAVVAAVGGFLWGLLLLEDWNATDFPAAMAHTLMQTLLALALFVVARRPRDGAEPRDFDRIAVAFPSAFALLMFAALRGAIPLGLFEQPGLTMAIIAGAALAASGLVFMEAAALTLAASALLLAALIIWPAFPGMHVSLLNWDEWPPPLRISGFSGFAFVTVIALALTATLRLLRTQELRAVPAAIYAAAGTLTPLAALAIAYLRLRAIENGNLFAALAAGLAFLFLVGASVFQTRREAQPSATIHLGLGTYAAAALAALALGLVFALDRGMLTVALALAALGAAFVDRRLDVAALRWGVVVLAGIVAVRLVIEPRIVGADLGTTPIFNWLLWGYGVPALAFAAAAELMRPRREDAPVHIAQGLAILFAAFLVFFEIRHAIHGGDPFAPGSGLVEQGLMATAAFAYALVLTRLDAARTNVVLRTASLGFGAISFAVTLFGLLLSANPLFQHGELEGGPIVNVLMLGYGVPAVLAYFLSRLARGARPDWYVYGARLCCHFLVFAYINLELRRLMHGPVLGLFGPYLRTRISDTEFYAYSALWLGLGIVYLAYGLLRQSREARLASAILVVASVGKVFLFDLNGLHGILRALSFIGLGLVLMAVGFVYQKLVFARGEPQA